MNGCATSAPAIQGLLANRSAPPECYALFYYLVPRFAAFQGWLLIGTAIVMTGSILAALSVSMSKCLVVVMFAPTATVVAYEMLGFRYQAEALGA